jgi:hypothetical protein
VKELAMVIPIDAVRCGAGFDAAGRWHEPRAVVREREAREEGAGDLAPARGAVYGLLLSGVLWVGLAAVVRAVLAFVR